MYKYSKNRIDPELLISVESRKGGVGKTTAALCLGRLLKNRGYTVLVIDLDLTGTNAADIAGSPFWVNDLHIICESRANITDAKTASEPVNLLALFEMNFMTGMTIPAFSISTDTQQVMAIKLDKVNVLGSQIFRTQELTDGQSGKSTTCIERPGILFDDLHTIWMLEFVKSIVKDFTRASGVQKCAIVLDNSPGYVGIAPAIHEWLTDKGPELGKFLAVTSLDSQDLLATNRGIDALHGLYTNKWHTSRLFINAGKEGSEVKVAKHQESFFMRLASEPTTKTEECEHLGFYRCLQNESKSARHCDGQDFCNSPSRYLSAIINRVPRSVKSRGLAYDLPSLSPVLSDLLVGRDKTNDGHDRMIAYDEYIENQFLLHSLRRGHRHSERRNHHLMNMLRSALHELMPALRDDKSYISEIEQINGMNSLNLRREILRANDIVRHAVTAVDSAGLGHLARLIDEEWLAGSIIRNFQRELSELFRDSELSYVSFPPVEYDTGATNREAVDYLSELKDLILHAFHKSRSPPKSIINLDVAEMLAGHLAKLASLSLTSPMWHSPYREEIALLFAQVLAIELKHWSKRIGDSSGKVPVQRFLAQESLDPKELERDVLHSDNYKMFRHRMMRDGDYSLTEFYKACTTAQSRMIDFLADSRFLIELLQFIVEQDSKSGRLIPFVRGLAEEVIVTKSIRHEDAPKKMAKALGAAEYFKDFERVLDRVLADWGVSSNG